MKRIRPKSSTDAASPQGKAIKCKFCGHYYLQPCDEQRRKTCRNVKVRSGRSK